MTSKRRLRRRACGQKVRYPDRAAARYAIWEQRARWTALMAAYRCPFCGQRQTTTPWPSTPMHPSGQKKR